MLCTVNARVPDTHQARVLVDALVAAGIPSDAIRVIEPVHVRERIPDPVSAGTISWGLLGGIAGGAAGWLIMSWFGAPWAGALFGTLVGGLCSGAPGATAPTDEMPEASGLQGTLIQVDAQDQMQTERAQRLFIDHRAWAVMVAGT